MPLLAATNAMGCRFEFALDGRPEPHLRAAADEAIAEIEALHRRLSPFDKASLTSHIARSAHLAPVRLDADTFDLFADALSVWHATAGAFDITVGAVMQDLGLHPRVTPLHDPPPPLRGGSPNHQTEPIAPYELDHNDLTIRLTAPARLDLGAIAKGHALDLAARILSECAVPTALLHAGASTALAIGAPPGQESWRIGLAGGEGRPDDDAPIVNLRDAALSVSAPHGRTLGEREHRITHIIDPRTRVPAARALVGAVIVPVDLDPMSPRALDAPSATPAARLADAWSTPIVITGERPPAMPRSFTTCILTTDGWRIEGPAQMIDCARPPQTQAASER